MNIFIRAYGSHLMGMGHLYRVEKLVAKLKEQRKCNITLLTRDYTEAKNIYKNIKVDNTIEIASSLSEDEELLFLDDSLKKKYDICINDQLNTSVEIATLLTKNSSKNITFDDLGDGNYLFDNIINVLYPSSKKLKNELNSYQYMILNDYSKLKDSVKFSHTVKTIFINQGAADTWGAIPDMIKDLNQLNEDLKIKVLLGPSFKHYDALAEALKVNTKQVEIYNYTSNVVDVVKDCNLAILGAGNTLFEVASLGIPIIASTREEKELITIRRLLNDNIVYSDNIIYKNSLNIIVNRVIKDIDGRKQKYEKNRKLFQYNGLDNIIKLIDGE
ncbi:MAG: glycosyltransferase [Candidatus Gracilibacteria bacterium]